MKAINIRHRPELNKIMEYQTLHVEKDRSARKQNIKGKKIVDAFLAFDEKHPRSSVMHYITDAAEDVLFDIEGNRMITVTMLRPQQLVAYYKQAGADAPKSLMNEARINAIFNRNML